MIRHRYLLLIGLVTLVIQLVNTNGNFIFDTTLSEMAEAVGGSRNTPADSASASSSAAINAGPRLLSERAGRAILQFFAVSRILKYMGVSGALFVMPLLALMNYSIFALLPGPRPDPRREDHRECRRLLAAEHAAPRAVPADQPRSQVQGAQRRRDVLLARRRHALGPRDLHCRAHARSGGQGVCHRQHSPCDRVARDRRDAREGKPEAQYPTGDRGLTIPLPRRESSLARPVSPAVGEETVTRRYRLEDSRT